MDTIDLIYYFAVLLMASLILFMRFTASNPLLEFIGKVICKIVPLFVIIYSMYKLF